MRLLPVSLVLILAAACTDGDTGSQGQDSSGPADETAPDVKIKTPDEGDEVAGTVTVETSVDDDVAVTSISFEVDGVQVSELTESPWEPTWDTTLAANGVHDLTVRAVDAAGNEGFDTVRVTVGNESGAPAGSVMITSPRAGATVCGEIPIYASVSGPATMGQLWVDGEEKAADTDPPFRWTWNSAGRADGAHVVQVVATLESGLQASDIVTIESANSDDDCDDLPQLSFAEPDAGDFVGDSKDIEIDATDDRGIEEVQFAVDGIVGSRSLSKAPYAFTWDATEVPDGIQTVVATAIDSAGQSTEARTWVLVDHTLPTLTVTSPSADSVVQGMVTVSAEAADENGIKRVELQVDQVDQPDIEVAPYEWTFDADALSGQFKIEVTAVDMAGNRTKNEFYVEVNGLPTVTITDPGDGDTVSGEQSIVATVTDDGDVQGVDFYVDGVLSGSDKVSTYRYNWDTCGSPNATYLIEAVATDDAGQTGSDSIYLTVDQDLSVEIDEPSGEADPSQDLVALVSDDQSIVSVTYSVDGAVVATSSTGVAAPGDCSGDCDDLCESYTTNVDFSALADGTHGLDVLVENDLGETASDSVFFTIDKDTDGDGHNSPDWGGDDCDDGDRTVYTGATESCDGLDQDCDGLIDEDFDADGDGFSDVAACSAGTDCDDADPGVNPDAAESCDGVDNNCDGYTDVSAAPTSETDTFDSGSLNTSATSTLRGNVYWAGRDMIANYFEVDMDPGTAATTWSVYESDSADGQYTLVASKSTSASGGDAWYNSGSLDLELSAGKYYLFASYSTDTEEMREDRAAVVGTTGELTSVGAVRDATGTADTRAETPDSTRLYSQKITVQWVEDEDTDADGDSLNEWCGDCDDDNADRYLGAEESCDGLDNDCDGTTPASEDDADADGDRVCDGDCDDADAARFPSNYETCDGIDNDCDGLITEDETDDDGDGQAECLDCSSGTCVIDCDDTDPLVLTPTWYADLDGDGYGDDTTATSECPAPAGFVRTGGDCDDSESLSNPAQLESCDGLDNDCDGAVDNGFDNDADGYGDCVDCDDADAAVNPGETEVCGDGTDNDCDGLATECQYSGPLSLYDADTVIVGDATSDQSGSHASIRDVDGDGFVDALVGAYVSDSGGTNAGAVFFVSGPLGTAVDLGDGAAVKMLGESTSDALGFRTELSDDLDGDGLGDGLTSAYEDDDAGSAAGAAYILSQTMMRDGSVRGTGWKITGATAGDNLGQGLAALGDSDADGNADFAVGSGPSGTTDAGTTYVFYGPVSASRAATTADAILTGETRSDNAGIRLCGPGDLDGDGFTDLLIGAYGEDTGGTSAGAVYLVYGPPSSMSLASADAKFTGGAASDNLGYAMAGAGDVDGDGGQDLVLGAAASDPFTRSAAGSAYLFLGDQSGEISVSSADATLTGDSANDATGVSVAGTGDMDSDGYGELLIGANADDDAGTGAGSAYLFYGPVSGSVSVSSYNASFQGEAAGDEAGTWVGAPGDVDGDGLPDMLITAQSADLSGTNTGAVYLVGGTP